MVVKTRDRTEGSYLNIFQATWGNVAMVRAADYAKHSIKQGENQQIYNLGIVPLYPIYRRYNYEDSQNGFILRIDENGILYILPIGQDIELADAINFSETFLLKS